MNTELFLYSCLMLLGVFISTLSQVLLKMSANERHSSYLKEYLNVKVITAYVLFLGSTFLSIVSFQVVPLSFGNILDTFGYIFITIFSATFFNENITLSKLFSLFLIICGTLTYTLLG